MSSSKYEEALQSFSKAVELDPKFGMGYQGLASVALEFSHRFAERSDQYDAIIIAKDLSK